MAESAIMESLKKFISLIFSPRFLGMLSTLYGVFSLVRDEFLPLATAEKLRLGGIFEMIDWYWWVICGLIIWTLAVAWEVAKYRKENSNIAGNDKSLERETSQISFAPINLAKLRLAKGGFVNYPETKFHNVLVEEYTFTVINETGQDLKRCFVLLDEVWVKNDLQTKGAWKLEAKDIFDKPFRWAKSELPIDGKIDIANNDKASFILVELIRSSALNVTENRNEPYLDFRLAMIGEAERSHGLYTGWDHRLVFTIRARNKDNRDFSIKYSIYLHPHSINGLIDIKIVRERQKQSILKTAT